MYGLGLIGQQDSTGYNVYHFDFRGSTVALTNSSGVVTDRFTYGAYGELLTRTGSNDTPFLYNGRDGILTDANGLYYMRARYYSPELKRFLNADSKKGSIDKIQTLNLYSFVVGNPISLIDPAGMSAEFTLASQLSTYNIYLSDITLPNIMLSKKRTARPDTGLQGYSDQEIHDKARDKSLPPQERRRYQTEEKIRGLRNKQKRTSNISIDPTKLVVGTLIVIGAGIAAVLIASDDVTGIGVLDDGLEIPISGGVAYGLQLIVGAAF